MFDVPGNQIVTGVTNGAFLASLNLLIGGRTVDLINNYLSIVGQGQQQPLSDHND